MLKDSGFLTHSAARLPLLNSEHFHGLELTLNLSGLLAHTVSQFISGGAVEGREPKLRAVNRYITKKSNPIFVSVLASLSFSCSFPRFRILNADKINGTIIAIVKRVDKSLPRNSVNTGNATAVSVRTNRAPTIILPSSCNSVFASMIGSL
jgi:hypothetical protein